MCVSSVRYHNHSSYRNERRFRKIALRGVKIGTKIYGNCKTFVLAGLININVSNFNLHVSIKRQSKNEEKIIIFSNLHHICPAELPVMTMRGLHV